MEKNDPDVDGATWARLMRCEEHVADLEEVVFKQQTMIEELLSIVKVVVEDNAALGIAYRMKFGQEAIGDVRKTRLAPGTYYLGNRAYAPGSVRYYGPQIDAAPARGKLFKDNFGNKYKSGTNKDATIELRSVLRAPPSNSDSGIFFEVIDAEEVVAHFSDSEIWIRFLDGTGFKILLQEQEK